AVDVERLPRDRAGIRQRQEDGGVADLLRLHHSPQRDLTLEVPIEDLGARERPRLGVLLADAHPRSHVARADRVDRDAGIALSPELGGERAGEPDHAVLGRRVRRDIAIATVLAEDGGDRDDAARVLGRALDAVGQIAEDEIGALGGEGERDGASDAATGTGDHDDAAGQPHQTKRALTDPSRVKVALTVSPAFGLKSAETEPD